MLVRKLKSKNLVAGDVYIAFSSKSKMLSSNGDKGVLVKVIEVKGSDVKATILFNNRVISIKNLDSREDAWMYSPDKETKLLVNAAGKEKLFPGFTPRMEKAFQGKQIMWDVDHLFEHVVEGQEGLFYRFEQDGLYNNFNFAWINPVEAPEWRIPRANRMEAGAVEVLLPPKPVSAEEEALIVFLKEPLAQFKKHVHHTYTSAFTLIDKEGKVKVLQERAACHYELKEHSGIHYILSGCRKDERLTDVEYKAYITYLTVHSPYKDAFLVKNADWIMENGYVLTGNVSAQVLAGACIATRQVWEYNIFVKAFIALAEKGVPLNLAFLFGNFAVSRGDTKIAWGAGGTGHSVFSMAYFGDKEMVNFHEGKVKEENKKPYYEDSDYNGVHLMWGTTKKGRAKVLDDLSKIGGVGARGVPPALSIEDAVEEAVEFIADWIQENL